MGRLNEIRIGKHRNAKLTPFGIYQINIETNEIIHKYPSVEMAKDRTGINKTDIYNCVNAKKDVAGGFKWIKDSNNNILHGNFGKSSIGIFQVDIKTNEIIRKFTSVDVAKNITGINKTGIYDCINGKQNTAGGFKWFKEAKK